MGPLPLPTQTLTWLTHAEQAGQCDAQVMLHLLNRADANDQDVAKFLNSYNATIAALCRRLEALERTAGLRHSNADAKGTQSDSVADAVQRIIDHAAKAGLKNQDWARLFSAAPVPAPEPVTECPNCGYERGIAPAPQAGEVEA